ncbi:IclR family transcriptional regulator [Thermodesulfobacteriota bacterium]
MKSIKHTLDVLNSFSPEVHTQGVTEIARKLGMHKSKVSRILSALNAEGVVIKTEYNQKYRLGLKILDWAEVILSKSDLRNIALPNMEKLRQEAKESIHLWIIQDKQRVCIEGIQGPQTVIMVVKIGVRFPIHAGAAGKVLFAYLPKNERDNLLQNLDLKKVGPKTIINKKKLESELTDIRKQGFAISFEERVPLGASIACPIRNHTGETIAALSIDGVSGRFTPQKVKKFITLLKRSTIELSERLGYKE